MCRETQLLLRMKWDGFLSLGFVGGLPPTPGAEDSLGGYSGELSYLQEEKGAIH